MASPPLSSTDMRNYYDDARCDTSEMTRCAFPGPDEPWNLLVETQTLPAWEMFASVMEREGYLFRESAGGTYNCRMIAGTDTYSLHSYGLAIDLNPSKNGPQGTDNTDQPVEFRNKIKAIVTKSGRQVFAWGGDWSASSSDPMHWQIGATPSEIASGIVNPYGEEDEMTPADWDKLRDIVREELNALLAVDDDKTSKLSRNVWQHGGVFKESKSDDDNAQRTVQRIAGSVG